MNEEIILLLTILLILLGSASSAAILGDGSLVEWKKYSPETLEQARRENKPLFMVFYADWCHSCKLYAEKTLHTDQVAGLLKENFIPVMVDFDDEKEIVHQHSVSAPPTTVILTSEGEEVVSILGFIRKERLMEDLNASLTPLRNGQKEVARKIFQHNSFQRLSQGNVSPRTAMPLEGGEVYENYSRNALSGLFLLILAGLSAGAVYRVFKTNR